MDDLDGSIARRTAKNSRYPEMLQAEIRRQRLIAALIAERKANHLTQAQVAAEMNLSQSVVAEIESSKADVAIPRSTAMPRRSRSTRSAST